jgi:glycerate kinase
LFAAEAGARDLDRFPAANHPSNPTKGFTVRQAVKLLCLSGAAAVVIGLGGCASAPTPAGMTVTSEAVQVNPKLKGSVTVTSVTAGKDVAAGHNAAFRKALEDTLSRAGYLAANGSAARYRLTAELRQLEQPLGSADLHVTSDVQYKLTGPSGPAQDLPVMAVGSATSSDGFTTGQRMRIASERAIQENIKVLLNQLADVE